MEYAVENLTKAMQGINPDKKKKGRPKKADSPGCMFFWRQVRDGEYWVLQLPEGQSIGIRKELDKFVVSVTLKDKKMRGVRDTLEQAFKAADRIYYDTYKDWWLKTDVREVIEPWMGDLNL